MFKVYVLPFRLTVVFLLLFCFSFLLFVNAQATAETEHFPATLDLVDRAELTINPLTSFADENQNYATWWQGISSCKGDLKDD